MIYEIGYLIIPTVPEDKLAPEVSKLKEILEEVSAEVISDEYPVLISLEYEMTKRIETKNVHFAQGYFGWVKFETTPEHIEKIKKQLDLNKVLLRYILITTVRENTIASKKPLVSSLVSRSSRTPKVNVEDALPLDEEAVDQEIDKLVEDIEVETSDEKVAETPESTETV